MLLFEKKWEKDLEMSKKSSIFALQFVPAGWFLPSGGRGWRQARCFVPAFERTQ